MRLSIPAPLPFALVLLLGAACAHQQPRVQPTPAATSTNTHSLDRHAMESALRNATARLDSAMFAVDTTGLATIMAPDGYLIVQAGDSARNVHEIAKALLTLRDSSAQRVSVLLDSRSRDACVDGGVDRGIYSLEQIKSDGTRETTAGGSYVALWRVNADDQPALRVLALSADSARHESAQGIRCTTLTDRRYDGARIFATVSMINADGSNTGSEAMATFNSRGWTGPGDRMSTSFYQRPELQDLKPPGGIRAISEIAARVRVYRGLSLETQDMLTPVRGTISASNTPDHEYDARYDEHVNSALLSLERHRLRLGLGVARVQADWRTVEYHAEYLLVGTPNESRYEYMDRSTHRSTAVGPDALLAYSVPMHDLAFFEVRLEHRQGLKATMPAVTGYDAWTAHFDGTTLSIALGGFF